MPEPKIGHFLINSSLPASFRVTDTAPPENATRTYSVIADYGWCERILCSDSYLDDANSIAEILGGFLGILVKLHIPYRLSLREFTAGHLEDEANQKQAWLDSQGPDYRKSSKWHDFNARIEAFRKAATIVRNSTEEVQ